MAVVIPKIVSRQVIGRHAGDVMERWVEEFPGGVRRTFEEYPATCWLPSMGRFMGLTLVREVFEPSSHQQDICFER